MIQDDEFEVLVTTKKRIKELGFKPQKEILTNHLLPYSNELDVESQQFLSQVKTNLAKSVMLREMKPACGVWSSRLMKYIRIYGLKFGKEDHIAFTKLAYELVLIPDLEPCKFHKFATLFLMLTKKRDLIQPDEMTLPWRPLYDVGKKMFQKNSTSIGMYHYHSLKQSENQEEALFKMIRKFMSGYGLDDALQLFGLTSEAGDELPTSLEGSYMSMIKCAKPYFELAATKEILEEMLPQINPWSTDSDMMSLLTALLPVEIPPQNAALGHELWFDQLMTLWDTCFNSSCGISDVMILFAGLAKKNPGIIDWTPHVPKMFMRFLHALNLPVSYKDMQYSRSHSLDMKHVASWIVWTINPDGIVLKHLKSFLAGVESYLHSANSGRWSNKLRDLLRKLAREFLNRVRREREKNYKTFARPVKESYKLRDEDITEFVTVVLEPTLQAVYSRNGSLDISVALQNLATLRPAIVIPPLVERLKTSLTSLTEPHRVTAAMSAVAAVARPLLRGGQTDYPEGPTHVVHLLMAVLPGLDPNDLKKTLVTLHFILMFSVMVPFIDCSSAHEHWPDLTEEELLVCESTAQFEDFILIFLDRIFIIIESSIHEQARLDTKDSDLVRSKTDAVMETAISSAATAVLMQCSPKIFKEALRKFKAFATESTFETNVSGSMVGILLRTFAHIDSESTLAVFLPKLCEELEELLATDEALKEENPPRDLVYRLVLFKHVVDCDGTVLLKYMPQILPILDRILKLHSSYALNRACEALNHIFASLSYIDIKEWRSSPNDYATAPEKWLPIREWGNGCMLKDSNFKWHVPTAEEAECAQMLIERYMKPEVTRLRQWLSGERDMCKERRLRCLNIINAALSCNSFLPQPNEEPVTLLESQVPATSMPFTNSVPYSVTLDGENMRVALTKLLREIQTRLLADKTDDTKGLDMLMQIWERVVVLKGLRTASALEARMRSYNALERALDGRGGGEARTAGTARLRSLLADAARLQDEARLDLVCEAGVAPSVLTALNALFELSINTYCSVRILAQIRLYWMLCHYPYTYRAIVPKLVELLSAEVNDDESHARRKGALYVMLGPKTGPIIAKQDWEVARYLWPAVLNSPLSEKPSILRLEQAVNDSLHRHFPTVNTRLNMSQSTIDAAKELLTTDQLNDPKFQEQFDKAVEREIANSDRLERLYLELVDEIVNVAEASNVQWRRLELSMQMLTFLPLIQTPYPPRAVHLMVRSLLHDDIVVRRTALRLTHFALKQRKRKLKKIEVDPYDIAGVPRPEHHVPGYRKDLEWAIWSGDKNFDTDEEWEKVWLRDPTYGFYAWPKKLKVAAPTSEQDLAIDIPPEQMEEGERYLYEFFSDDANIDKLVSFFTVEEKKGKDKFSGVRFTIFRMAIAQFGERVADRVLKAAEERAAEEQEAAQRFAAELAAAALRAPRYWPRRRAAPMLDRALRILTAGLTAVTPETMEDWGTAVATGIEKLEPRRCSRVLDTLLQLCVPASAAAGDTHASFLLCARLYALQGAIGSLTWRAAPLAAELLKRLESANFIQHPYQNVRETVGSMLMTIFDTELVFPGGDSCFGPRLKDFLASVKPRLAALYDENGDIMIKCAAAAALSAEGECGGGGVQGVGVARGARPAPALTARLPPAPPHPHCPPPPATHSAQAVLGNGGEAAEEAEEPAALALAQHLDAALRLSGDSTASHHAQALNLLTTALRGCMGIVVRGVNSNVETQYEVASLACSLAARGPPQPHEELPRAAGGFLASLALALHSYEAFDKAMDVLETLANGRSWWARLACVDFAQPLLFYGLPMLCDQPEKAVRAEKFALKLMRDARVEVRQAAANLLTGLMHCRALANESNTLKSFMKSCRAKELVERHCGVLGLCAYLASRPYSIGSKLGDVLAELARHTSAPDPIPATIRKALADFRRTHQDDWPKHREQLTEEELDLLADLTSPPSYCA